MGERQRIVIAEHQRLPYSVHGPEHVIYHLPEGPDQDDGWWQPIRCGGGIALHGGREKMPRSMACGACLANRKTM